MKDINLYPEVLEHDGEFCGVYHSPHSAQTEIITTGHSTADSALNELLGGLIYCYGRAALPAEARVETGGVVQTDDSAEDEVRYVNVGEFLMDTPRDHGSSCPVFAEWRQDVVCTCGLRIKVQT